MKIPGTADLILWGAVGLLGVGAIALVNHWRLDSGRLKVERTERVEERELAAARVSQLEERVAIEIENRRKADETSNHYQGELARLQRERTDTPARTVRLCQPARPAVPATVATSSGAASGGHHAAGSDGLPETAGSAFGDRWSDSGPDIGPELYALADEADRCAAQRDALQQWIRDR